MWLANVTQMNIAFCYISLHVEDLTHVGALHAVCVQSNSNSLSDGAQL